MTVQRQIFMCTRFISRNFNKTMSRFCYAYTVLGIIGTYGGYLSSSSAIHPSSNFSGMTCNNSMIYNMYSGSIGLTAQVTGVAYARTNSAYNLSDYMYLKIRCSTSKYNDVWTSCYATVSSNPNFTGFASNGNTISGTASNQVSICNISNLEGMYYIYLCVNSNFYAGATIYEITLSNS